MFTIDGDMILQFMVMMVPVIKFTILFFICIVIGGFMYLFTHKIVSNFMKNDNMSCIVSVVIVIAYMLKVVHYIARTISSSGLQ